MGCERDTSISDLAAELDLNEESIRRHTRRGAPFTKRDNRLWFNVAEYLAWMNENKLTGERGKPSQEPMSTRLEAVRIRKETALARKYEAQAAKDEGQLMPTAEMRAWAIEHHRAFQRKLLRLGDELSPSLEGRDNAERAETINSRVREILSELSEAVKRLDLGGDPPPAQM